MKIASCFLILLVSSLYATINPNDSLIIRKLLGLNGHANIEVGAVVETGRPGDGNRVVKITVQGLKIDSFPQEMDSLDYLSEVNLKGDSIKKFPNFLTRKLVNLNLSNNLIDSIPKEYFGLFLNQKSVWFAHFDHNNIRMLPDEVSQFRGQWFTLHQNKLHTLPVSILDAEYPDFLGIDSNYICNPDSNLAAYLDQKSGKDTWRATQICPTNIIKPSRTRTQVKRNDPSRIPNFEINGVRRNQKNGK